MTQSPLVYAVGIAFIVSIQSVKTAFIYADLDWPIYVPPGSARRDLKMS